MGCGEDNSASEADGSRALIAVFDGCGGLGSRRYPSDNNRSGAYLAANIAASVTAESFETYGYDDLSKLLFDALSSENARLNSANIQLNIRSDMLCPLPTTVCAALIENDGCNIQWIGDSRLFALDRDGLHILTDDEGDFSKKETYFFERRLTGYANAACRFKLHCRAFKPVNPCLLFAATDGMYRAFPSPMETEAALLDALDGIEGSEDFRVRLRDTVDECADDDFTAVFTIMGAESLKAMANELSARTKRLRHMLLPLYEPDADFDKARAAVWKSYKDSYFKYYSGD